MRVSQTLEAPTDEQKKSVEAAANEPSGPPLVSLDSPIFQEVSVELSAKLGQVSMPVAELLALKSGSVVKLGAKLNDFVELRLGQSVVARGEIVAVGEHFGVRIVDVAKL
jgi:flagellar motor switch protein FliN/FliY